MKWPYCLNCAIFPPNKKELHGEQCAVRLDLSTKCAQACAMRHTRFDRWSAVLVFLRGQMASEQKRIALSPDLPLKAGQFEPPAGLDLHPVFEDAGPDRWGRQIIDKVFQLPRRSPIDYLATAGEDRIGALGFSSSPDDYVVAKEQAFQAADLADLLRAAQALEHHMPINDEMRRLLRPGASAGGARLKAIIQDRQRHWIAKFPAEGDIADM